MDMKETICSQSDISTMSFSGIESDQEQNVSSSMSELQLFHCAMCSIGFDSFLNFQKHANSLEHVKMVQNKTMGAVTDSAYSVSKESSKDKIVVEKYFNPNSAFPILPTPHAKCEICQKHFSGPEPYQQHLVSAGHKKKLALQSLQTDRIERKLEFKVIANDQQSPGYKESSNTAYCLAPSSFAECTLCQKYFSGPEPYQQHLVSAGHKKKIALNQWQNVNKDGNQCQVGTTMAEKQKIPESAEAVSRNFPALVPPPYAECEICEKQFSGPEPYQQHLVSAAHKKKTAFQHFKINSRENQGDSSMLVKCSICDISFQGPSQYAEHLNSSLHQSKALEEDFAKSFRGMPSQLTTSNEAKFRADLPLNLDWYCKTCDKHCSGPMPYNQHIVSQAHQKKLRYEEIEANLSRFRNVDGQTSNGLEDSPTSTKALSKINNSDTLNQLSKELEMNYVNSNLNQLNDVDKTNNFSKGFNIDCNDLILGDALKHLNVISPEDLNVTIFRPDEEIKFDYPVKMKSKESEKNHIDEFLNLSYK